jgi:hypothetical protein
MVVIELSPRTLDIVISMSGSSERYTFEIARALAVQV